MKLMVTLLFMVTANASLIGLIENSAIETRFNILDYQEKDTVNFDMRFKSGNGDPNERQVFFNLPIDNYLDIFNSNKNVSVSSQKLSLGEISYSATGELTKRNIQISYKTFDDENDVSHKYNITIKLNEDTADLEMKMFGRKRIFFYVTDLRLRVKNKAKNVSFKRNGVCLYGDNLGWPLGKVITEEGLISAAADTSTLNLQRASEAKCDR